MTSVWVNNSLCIAGSGGVVIGNDVTDPTHPISMYVQGNYYAKGVTSPVGTDTNRITSSTIAGGHCWVGKNYAAQVYATTTSRSRRVATRRATRTTRTARASTRTRTARSRPRSRSRPSGRPAPTTRRTRSRFRLRNRPRPEPGLAQVRQRLDPEREPRASGASQPQSDEELHCRTYDASGNLIGQLTYVSGSPGTLTINGNVYIDGSLTFPGGGVSRQAKYVGQGTLYVEGPSASRTTVSSAPRTTRIRRTWSTTTRADRASRRGRQPRRIR